MATNGHGYFRGMLKDRYQVFNELKGLWDKYDGSGNHLALKKSPGPWKGVEVRNAMKPPRR